MWHHIMNRGLERRTVFRSDTDRRRFLKLLRECARRYEIVVHAYCLMGNHYHLLVQDNLGNLSRAMRHLNGVYTQGFNRLYHRDGPLFRGRFRAQAVQQEGYALEVVRYIHLNPVRARLVARANDYLWSSHLYYVSARQPPWLCTATTLESFGHDRRRLAEFDAFVHERLEVNSSQPVVAANSCVFGGEAFVDECRARVRANPRRTHREVVQGRHLARLSMKHVLQVVASVFSVTVDELLRGQRGRRNDTRLVAIWVCHTQTDFLKAQIAETFGVRPSSIQGLAQRGELRLREHAGAVGADRLLAKVLDM
jgi:putative transposase